MSKVTTYRLAMPPDETALLQLWVAANPGTTEATWRAEAARIPNPWQHTFVAVAPDGKVIASARFWPREVRNAEGEPVRVGTVSHVATHPNMRRQGHARRLMELVIEAMQEDGCEWSYLTTSEAARFLYEQLGWRTAARPVWQGIASRKGEDKANQYSVTPYNLVSEPEGWKALSYVYSTFNASRPLTMVRTDTYWNDFFVPHLQAWSSEHTPTVFAAWQESQVCGYAIVYYSDTEAARPFGLDQLFTVSELCTLPDREAAVTSLLQAVVQHAQGNTLGGRLYLPRIAQFDRAVMDCFGHTAHSVFEEEPMVRPLAPHTQQHDYLGLFNVPGAYFWPLDEV